MLIFCCCPLKYWTQFKWLRDSPFWLSCFWTQITGSGARAELRMIQMVVEIFTPKIPAIPTFSFIVLLSEWNNDRADIVCVIATSAAYWHLCFVLQHCCNLVCHCFCASPRIQGVSIRSDGRKVRWGLRFAPKLCPVQNWSCENMSTLNHECQNTNLNGNMHQYASMCSIYIYCLIQNFSINEKSTT
jgi:hypothetical protein